MEEQVHCSSYTSHGGPQSCPRYNRVSRSAAQDNGVPQGIEQSTRKKSLEIHTFWIVFQALMVKRQNRPAVWRFSFKLQYREIILTLIISLSKQKLLEVFRVLVFILKLFRGMCLAGSRDTKKQNEISFLCWCTTVSVSFSSWKCPLLYLFLWFPVSIYLKGSFKKYWSNSKFLSFAFIV